MSEIMGGLQLAPDRRNAGHAVGKHRTSTESILYFYIKCAMLICR